MADTRLFLTAGPAILLALAAGAPARRSPVRATANEIRACTEPYDGLRSNDFQYFVATAGDDTVPVGNGMFGQAARVSSIAGPVPPDISSSLPSDGTVLLVPWGFDDECEPIQWTGSWLWARVGEAGFYRGRLRSNERWVDDRPTLDVYRAVWEGFPNSPWNHPMQGGQSSLSANELFELYELLPTVDEVAERPYGAVSRLVDWRRDAHDKLGYYPARTILESAFRNAEIARVRKAPIPFAGTYRMQLEKQGEVFGTFFLRTGQAATAPVARALPTGSHEVPSAPMPTGFFVAPAALALSEVALGIDSPAGGPSECMRLLGLYAAEDETPVEGAVREWSAELPLTYVATCLSSAEYLKDLRSAQDSATKHDRVGIEEKDPVSFESYAGLFRQESDGRFTFRQPAMLGDGVRVHLVGERIGLEALPAVHPTDPSGS